MPRETELTAELREDERERQRQRVRELREQHAQRRDVTAARRDTGTEFGRGETAELEWRRRQRRGADGLVRKAMDTLPRASEPVPEVPDLLVLFGDRRDKQLVDAFGATIAIVRRQLRKEFAEELAERDPQLRKIAALELEVAKLSGAVAVMSGKEPQPTPAKFPKVKSWRDGSIAYAGDIVTFAGSTYQAKCDTAQAPGSADWACLAAAGRSLTVRGTYDSNVEYRSLDVAMVNGSSFVALRDWPGPCPGDGWHLLASRGSRGSRGERGFAGLMGLRGERGEATPVIQSWHVDKATYRATPVMSNGTLGPPLELRALFEQFLLETSDG